MALEEMKYTVVFDSSDPDGTADIYLWVHANGGYRYVELQDGKWGRLPSTCIVLDVNMDSAMDVSAWFKHKVECELGASVKNVCALPGEPCGYADEMPVPNWAKDRITAMVEHCMKVYRD